MGLLVSLRHVGNSRALKQPQCSPRQPFWLAYRLRQLIPACSPTSPVSRTGASGAEPWPACRLRQLISVCTPASRLCTQQLELLAFSEGWSERGRDICRLACSFPKAGRFLGVAGARAMPGELVSLLPAPRHLKAGSDLGLAVLGLLNTNKLAS